MTNHVSLRLSAILTDYPKLFNKSFREVVYAGLGTRDPKKIVKCGGEEFVFTIWLLGTWRAFSCETEQDEYPNESPVLMQWTQWLHTCYSLQRLVDRDDRKREMRDNEEWTALMNNIVLMSSVMLFNNTGEADGLAPLDDESVHEMVRTAASYRRAIKAAVVAHPKSDFGKPFASVPGLRTATLLAYNQGGKHKGPQG